MVPQLSVNKAGSDQPALHLPGHSLSAAAVRGAVVPASIIVFLSMLPVTMLVPVLKEIVADRFQADTFWTHSFMWINMVGAIIAAPLIASLSDRLPERRTILAIALVLDGGLIWAIAASGSLGLMLLMRFFEGAAHIVAISTLMAYGADWSGEAHRGRVMGMLGGAMMLGTAVGPPLGGMWGNANPVAVLWLGGGFSVMAALVALALLKPVAMRPRAKDWAAMRRLLADRPQLIYPYLYAFMDRLCVGVIVSSFVLFLGRHHGLAPAPKALLLGLFLFPFSLLCYPIGRWTDRIGRVGCMFFGNLGFGAVFALYGVVSLDVLRGLMVISGVLSAIMFAPNLAICADMSPPDRRATAYAGFNLAGSLGFVLGPLLGGIITGPIAETLDLHNPYALVFPLVGGIQILIVLLTTPWALRTARAARAPAV